MRSSLTLRLIIAILLGLGLIIPLISISLEQAFQSSLENALKQRLQSQLYFLVGELEVDDNNIYMPELVADETLNQLESGTYAFIQSKQLEMWHSRSAALLDIAAQLKATKTGDETFAIQQYQNKAYYQLSLTVLFDVYDNEQPFSFHVIYDKQLLDQDITSFRGSLWRWLAFISLGLIVLQGAWLFLALSPLRRLQGQISRVERGEQQQIDRDFPTELHPVTVSINKLISTESQQRTRYKNSLSDLAHALKTPLAILRGQKLTEDGEQQVDRINQMIEHQLKRAASSGEASWHIGIKVAPVLDKLHSAMDKIYRDKHLDMQLDIDPQATFFGDQTDLMEIVGNLFDNACKAATSAIHISAEQDQQQLIICVADDGKGVAEQDKEKLLQRGTRLDTYEQGHGVGLAIVKDLVTSYKGELTIEDSVLGGARFVVRFKLN